MNDPLMALLGSFGEWAEKISILSIVFRLVLVILTAGAIGWERAEKRHAAGLRTFILVALGGAGAMLLDGYLMMSYGSSGAFITAATIIAIALIATYSIVYSAKSQIKGLTTSVALWATGLMGMTFGAGFYTAGLLIALSINFIISVIPPVERWLKDRSNHFEIHLELKNRTNLQEFVAMLRKLGMVIDDIEVNPAYANSGLYVYSMAITVTDKTVNEYKQHSDLIEALSSLDYVNYVSEIQ